MTEDREIQIVIRGKNLTGPEFEAARKAMAGLSAEADRTSAAAKRLPASMQEFNRSIGRVAGSTGTLTGGLRGLAATAAPLAGLFGVTLGAGALASFASRAIDAADRVGDLASKMGVSVQAAQRFGRAAQQSGADIGNISQAIVQMNNRLAEGDKSTIASLNAAGLSLDALRSLRPEEAFRQIADAIARIPDPMLQTKIAMDAFGKSGAELLPMIRDGALAAADSMKVMDEATVKALKEAKQTWQNFWDDITIMSAKAMAGIVGFLDPTDEMKRDFAAKAAQQLGQRQFLKPPAGSGPNIDRSKLLIDQLKAGGGGPAGDVVIDPSSLGFSREEADRIKKAQEAEAKRLKELAEQAKRAEDAYRAFERQRITGFSDAERLKQEHELRFLRERNLLNAMYWGRDIVSRSPLSSILGPGIDLGYTPPIPSMALPMTPPSPKARGPISLQELLTSTGFTHPGATFGQKMTGSIKGLLTDAPTAILGALQGGGSVGKTIAGMFGGGLLGSEAILGKLGTDGAQKGMFQGGAGKFLQDSLGKTIGGALAGAIPFVGSLIGPLVGKLFGPSKTQIAGREATQQIDALQKQLVGPGGLFKDFGALEAKAKSVGMSFQDIWSRKGVDGLKLLQDRMQAFDAATNEQANAQQFLNSTIEKYGFTIDELGPKWRAQRLKEDATLLLREYTALTAAGVSNETVQKKMGRSLFDFLQTAKRTGAEVPLEFKKMAEEALKFGTLVGENGEQLTDLNGITWAETFSQSIDRVVSKLDELIRKITGDLGGALETTTAQAGRLTGEGVDEGPVVWGRRQAPDYHAALGGMFSGPLAIGIERGRKEMVGDEHFFEGVLSRVFARRGFGGGGDGGVTVNIQNLYARTKEDAQALGDELTAVLANKLRRSGKARIQVQNALALSTGGTR